MSKANSFQRWFWVMLIAIVFICWCPNPGMAGAKLITPEAVRYSGPFDITAPIMEIDLKNNILIVAEREIHVVDLMVGSEHLLTIISDAEGEPVTFESLDRGQMVQVRGLQLPDNRVLAELIVSFSEGFFKGQAGERRARIRQAATVKRQN